MPQKSYGYAVGQVRVLEQNLLGRSALERLSSASSVDELARALTELGWGEAHTKQGIERLCDKHVLDACELVKRATPEPDVTDCFLLKYDILNLKVLLKSRVLGLVQEELSPCGTIDPELLRRAVSENSYQDLPPALKDVMVQIERRIAVAMDPLYVDARLDVAHFEIIRQKLARTRNMDIKRYFSHKADITNLLIALRSAHMGRGAQFALELLVPGGELPIDQVARVADEPERAAALTYMRPYSGMVKEALANPQRGAGLATLEKRMDDHLLSLIRPHRFEPTTVMPLVGYLLAREREAAAVRLIATAKNARVPQEKLSERLRELYA